MLSKGRRIKTEFFSRSVPFWSVHGHSLSARVSFSEEKQAAKVAVIVSKKVAKSAVERNRIRRRIYGAVKNPLLHMQKGVYILLYPKKETLLLPYKNLESDVRDILDQIQNKALKKQLR